MNTTHSGTCGCCKSAIAINVSDNGHWDTEGCEPPCTGPMSLEPGIHGELMRALGCGERRSEVKKRKVEELDYAESFDRLMEAQFGEKFSTGYNLFAMSYTTTREGGKRLTKQQALYGRGLSNGMAEALGKVRA